MVNLCKFGGNQDNGSFDFSFLVNHFIYLNSPLTLKMRSRSPKPNQLLSLAQ